MPAKYAKLATTDPKFLDPELLFGRDLNKQLTTLAEVSAITNQITSRTPLSRVHRGRGSLSQFAPPHPQAGYNYGFHPYRQQRGSRRPAYTRPYAANFSSKYSWVTTDGDPTGTSLINTIRTTRKAILYHA